MDDLSNLRCLRIGFLKVQEKNIVHHTSNVAASMERQRFRYLLSNRICAERVIEENVGFFAVLPVNRL